MRRWIATAFRTTVFSLGVFSAHAVVHARPALAFSVSWVQDSGMAGYTGGPGCATQISVGQNDSPWVLGCSGPGDNGTNKSVYQWIFSPCGSHCFGGTYRWVYQGGAGVAVAADPSVFDDYNNVSTTALLVTSDGHVWTGPAWADITQANSPSGPFGIGRLRSVVPTLAPYGVSNFSYTMTHTIYGLGYSSTPDVAIFSSAINTTFTTTGNVGYLDSYSAWTQVDAQDNAAASKLVLFTGITSGQPYGLLVALNSVGGVYVLNPFSQRFQQIPASPVTDITDHFVIATEQGSHGPYSVLYQFSDATNSWLRYSDASLTTPNGTQITRIAFSNLGPSTLWGLDTSNHIFAATSSITPS